VRATLGSRCRATRPHECWSRCVFLAAASLSVGGLAIAAAPAHALSTLNPQGYGIPSWSHCQAPASCPGSPSAPKIQADCQPNGVSTLRYTFSGNSFGPPYQGPFTETGTVTMGLGAPGVPPGAVGIRTWDTTFSIDSPAGRVTGTGRWLRLAGGPVGGPSASCDTRPDPTFNTEPGYALQAGGLLTYEAEIRSGNSVLRDRGTVNEVLSESYRCCAFYPGGPPNGYIDTGEFRGLFQTSAPSPRQGVSVNVSAAGGSVRVRRRGSRRFSALQGTALITVGSEVDTTRGTVALSSANPQGPPQTVELGGGQFIVRQGRGRSAVTEFALSRPLACAAGRASAVRSRRLSADGTGRFRILGRYASASARGTVWTTKDTCSTTMTSVRRGSVTVRDLVQKKTVTVRAGGSYTSRRRKFAGV
jgi:hypothetical protein